MSLIKSLVAIILIVLQLDAQRTSTDATIIHICDPPKLEFDVLQRHYLYGHDQPLTHIARGSWCALCN